MCRIHSLEMTTLVKTFPPEVRQHYSLRPKPSYSVKTYHDLQLHQRQLDQKREFLQRGSDLHRSPGSDGQHVSSFSSNDFRKQSQDDRHAHISNRTNLQW